MTRHIRKYVKLGLLWNLQRCTTWCVEIWITREARMTHWKLLITYRRWWCGGKLPITHAWGLETCWKNFQLCMGITHGKVGELEAYRKHGMNVRCTEKEEKICFLPQWYRQRGSFADMRQWWFYACRWPRTRYCVSKNDDSNFLLVPKSVQDAARIWTVTFTLLTFSFWSVWAVHWYTVESLNISA